MAEEIAGAAKICKFDAGENPAFATSYGVRSVPNLLFFKNGEVKDQFVGANITKEQMKARLVLLF
jgi:thioredoxin 1